MEITLVFLVSLAVLASLVFLAVETIREFRRMDRDPENFTGSDRLAGSAE